jgi:hypothetical protein
MLDNEVSFTSSGRTAPPEVRKFAERLMRQHQCPVTLTLERSGYHLYLPCPECLKDHGRKELQDPKYAINVSKHLGLGDQFKSLTEAAWFDTAGALENAKTRDDRVGICMRTRSSGKPHFFPVSLLLEMPTVSERHPDIHTTGRLVSAAGSADRESNWEIDPRSGKKCPPPPGKITPINLLPPNHPAVKYLTQRNFDPRHLWKQFRCGFCVSEWPEGHNAVFYRKMPGGWKDTPQHRIIFHAMIDGVPMSWQARYPEKLSDDGLNRYMLHPYFDAEKAYDRDAHVKLGLLPDEGGHYGWSHTHTRSNPSSAWIPVPPFDQTDETGTLKFQPSKYRTAKYSSRELLGWDAAVERANADDCPMKWVVLCEGPLDAARVGPGGIALMGASINIDNAKKVARQFNIVFTAFDTDQAGRGATQSVAKLLHEANPNHPVLQEVIPLTIPSGKDLGEMTQEAFDALFAKALRKAMKGL